MSNVVSAAVVSGELVIGLDDGSIIRAGYVQGPQGLQGPQGPMGATGSRGTDGNTIHTVAGTPGNELGKDGDYAIDNANWRIYGPRSGGTWGKAKDMLPGPLNSEFKGTIINMGGGGGGGGSGGGGEVILDENPPLYDGENRPLGPGALWFDTDQKALYVSERSSNGGLIWVISTPADRSVLQDEIPVNRFVFPGGPGGGRAIDGQTVYNTTTELWYYYNGVKRQWIDLPPGRNDLSMQAILLRGPVGMDETFQYDPNDRILYETDALCYVDADDHLDFTRIVIPNVDTAGFVWEQFLQLIQEGDQVTLLQCDRDSNGEVTTSYRSDYIAADQPTANTESYSATVQYKSESPDHDPRFGQTVLIRFKAIVNTGSSEIFLQPNAPTPDDNPTLSTGNVWIDGDTNLQYVWNGQAWEPISTNFAQVKCIENTAEESIGQVRYKGSGDSYSSDQVNGHSTGAGDPTTLEHLTFGDAVDVSLLTVGGKFTFTKGLNVDVYQVVGLTPFTQDGNSVTRVDVKAPATSSNSYAVDDILEFAVINLPQVAADCLQCSGDERTICEELDYLQNEITELEEEFENLLPSLDRGSWRYNEDFTKPPGKFGLRTDADGLPTSFDTVAKIILNATDDAGEPHGFGDIKVDSYIQLFQDGASDTAIYHVDALPVASGDEFSIEVSFVRAQGDYPELDELFRFKFYELVGGDAGAYVLKTGDQMTGDLTMSKDPLVDGSDSPKVEFKSKNDSGTTYTNSLYMEQSSSALKTSGAIHVGGNILLNGRIMYDGSTRIGLGSDSATQYLGIGTASGDMALKWTKAKGITEIRANNGWGSNGQVLKKYVSGGTSYVYWGTDSTGGSSPTYTITKENGNYYIQ